MERLRWRNCEQNLTRPLAFGLKELHELKLKFKDEKFEKALIYLDKAADLISDFLQLDLDIKNGEVIFRCQKCGGELEFREEILCRNSRKFC